MWNSNLAASEEAIGAQRPESAAGVVSKLAVSPFGWLTLDHSRYVRRCPGVRENENAVFYPNLSLETVPSDTVNDIPSSPLAPTNLELYDNSLPPGLGGIVRGVHTDDYQ